MMISLFDRVENTVGKGENAGHLSPLPTVFSKDSFSQHWRRNLFKKLWEKENMLSTIIFSFCYLNYFPSFPKQISSFESCLFFHTKCSQFEQILTHYHTMPTLSITLICLPLTFSLELQIFTLYWMKMQIESICKTTKKTKM